MSDPASPSPATAGEATRIRVLLVDDEPLARRGLHQLLAPHADLEVVGECRDGREVLHALEALAPDLVFLDVQMPEFGGLDLVRARGAARMPATIFLTAYEQFAVAAFEIEALDYLVKPVSETRFAEALARARRRLRATAAASDGPLALRALPRPACLVIPDARGRVVLTVDEIDWIGADDYYAAVYARGRRHLLRESLASLAGRLDPTRFVRVHRAAVVNVARVARVRTDAGETRLVLHDGTRLPVSRRRRAALDAALDVITRPRPSPDGFATDAG